MRRNKLKQAFNLRTAGVLAIAVILAGCGGGGSSLVQDSGEKGAIIEPLIGAAIGDVEHAPKILSISMGCDVVMESIAVNVGDTASFSLLVDDDDPTGLQYTVSSDDENVLSAQVGEGGVVSLEAIELGTTTVPVVVTDSDGNQDQILLNVIVES